MRSQFQQREALTEQTVVDRKVLADNNIIRINKETRRKIKGTESEWQGRASKWLATARRKVGLQHSYFVYGLPEWLLFATLDSSFLLSRVFSLNGGMKLSASTYRKTKMNSCTTNGSHFESQM